MCQQSDHIPTPYKKSLQKYMLLSNSFNSFAASRTKILRSDNKYVPLISSPAEGYSFRGKPQETLELAMNSARKCLAPTFLARICENLKGYLGIQKGIVISQSPDIPGCLLGMQINQIEICPHKIIDIQDYLDLSFPGQPTSPSSRRLESRASV